MEQNGRFQSEFLDKVAHARKYIANGIIIMMTIYRKSVADACSAGLTPAEAEWLVYEYYCVKMKCPPSHDFLNFLHILNL